MKLSEPFPNMGNNINQSRLHTYWVYLHKKPRVLQKKKSCNRDAIFGKESACVCDTCRQSERERGGGQGNSFKESRVGVFVLFVCFRWRIVGRHVSQWSHWKWGKADLHSIPHDCYGSHSMYMPKAFYISYPVMPCPLHTLLFFLKKKKAAFTWKCWLFHIISPLEKFKNSFCFTWHAAFKTWMDIIRNGNMWIFHLFTK